MDGSYVMGLGLLEILESIEREGSLQGAARRLGVSYSWLLGKLRRAEGRLGFRLVEARKGGREHGGASLTWEGRRLMRAYRRLRREIEDEAVRRWERITANFSSRSQRT